MENNLVLYEFLFELAKGLVLFIGGLLGSIFFMLGLRILLNKNGAWDKNREAVQMYNAGCPLTMLPFDYRDRVNPCLAVHTKTNTWVTIGSVSKEGIYDALS